MGSVGDSAGWGARGGRRPASAVVLTGGGWLTGIVVTALILGTPYLVFGYHSPGLHLVLDTLDGSVALLVAYLVHGRFRRSPRLQDLLLAQGLLLLAVAGLGVALVLELWDGSRPETLEVWLPLVLRVLAAMLVAASALVPERPARREPLRWAAAAPWAVAVVAAALLWWQRDSLPVAVDSTPPPTAQHPVITGHPLLLAAQGVTALSFMLASLAFTVRATRRDDELLRWLGPACALAAFARVSYLLFPSLYSGWFYTGDVLRTGCYLVLLVGAAREIGQYWATQTQAAVLEDRRRLARELHDGVVQELGYIRAEAHELAPAGGTGDRIVAACDRALDEARAAVDALGRSPEEPLSSTLLRAARQVAERYDGRLDAELDDSVTASSEQRHALVRITREAVSTALRHGRAHRVCLHLVREPDGGRLLVRDDGRGFDVDTAARRATGYGLTSMRERAANLPGSLTLRSEPGRGTEVGVEW
jgi:signal transduction histidine kinase